MNDARPLNFVSLDLERAMTGSFASEASAHPYTCPQRLSAHLGSSEHLFIVVTL